MHQTFYIDIDEEITSIVERLKKSKTKEIIIVVPKRALLIQSIINLKLLKKEADKLKKELIIVTQDKLGKMLVEKTGIIVEQRLDEVDREDASTNEVIGGEEISEEFALDKKFSAEKTELEDLGSNDYLDVAPKKNRRQVILKKKEEGKVEKILNKELVTDFDSGIRNKFFSPKATQSLDMVKNINIQQKNVEDEPEEILQPIRKSSHKENFKRDNFALEEDDEDDPNFSQNQKAEDFFARAEKFKRKEKENDQYKNVQVGGKAWKVFFWFCFLVLLAGGAAGAYLYLPKAVITITPKIEIKSLDLEMKGLTDITEVDFSGMAIPVKLVESENEVTRTFSATGTKSDSNKKARGTITIYNEFSPSPQPLVATTRFLSESGKLFRLEKSVSVPGTTKVGTEIKPGVIEAQVIADEAGSSFNIEPTKFTIPGFQGSGNDKYVKIYAKSSKAMTGGGDSGKDIKSISVQDMTNAKSTLSTDIVDGLKQEIKEENGEDAIILDDAISLGEVVYTSSAQEGAAAEEFNLTGKAKANFFVFQKKDLESLATSKIMSNTGIKKEQIKTSAFKFEFGKADADFTNGTILIRLSLKASVLPDFNLEEIKKDVLGKTENEFKAYISQYKDIESVYINYNIPFLAGKISAYPSRVQIILDNK